MSGISALLDILKQKAEEKERKSAIKALPGT